MNWLQIGQPDQCAVLAPTVSELLVARRATRSNYCAQWAMIDRLADFA